VIENYKLLEALMYGTWVLFAFAFGSCLGSLINVLVYRLPLGLDVVSPASRCPQCQTLLTWRENIPVLGWLMLKGKCRFCKCRISPEYPLVEGFVGLIFVVLYLLWFVLPQQDVGIWMGIDWAGLAPEWTRNGFGLVWPTYVMTVLLMSSLVAMTIIDARTFHIPLILTWIPMVLGVVGHTLHAVWIQSTRSGLRWTAEGDWWVIPTPGPIGWTLFGLAIGCGLGLLVSALLQKVGVLKQSYADYEQWEASVIAQDEAETKVKAEASETCGSDTQSDAQDDAPPTLVASSPRQPWVGAGVGVVAAIVLGMFGWLVGSVPWLWGLGAALLAVPIYGKLTAPKDGPAKAPTEADMWIRYPHARREALRELLWVTPAIALAAAGARIAAGYGANVFDPATGVLTAGPVLPLWLSVFGGALLGLLVGGGLIWGIRIFGSLAFGKEAMGMGDVWLMAAVGATLGWLDATLIFFVAPFIALYLTAFLWAWDGKAKRALPYGPALAAATLMVVVGERGFEWALGQMWHLGGPFILP